jgi:hypothetical protein
LNNFYTNTENCASGFTKYLLHQTVQFENKFNRECKSCGFLSLSHCCNDVAVGIGQRDLTLYTCYSQVHDVSIPDRSSTTTYRPNHALSDLKTNENYVYGGSFTSKKFNPVTNAHSCPDEQFQKVNVLDDITLCLAERITNTENLNLPHFGGMFSCNQGNMATDSNNKKCLSGYSSYVMGAIEGDCLLYVCLDFQQFEGIRQLPSIVLPPFFSIDIKNQTDPSLNSTNTNLTQTQTQTTTPSTFKDNPAQLGLSITAFVIGLITITIITYFIVKKKRPQWLNIFHNNSKSQTQTSTEA